MLVGVKAYDHSKLKPLDYPENDVTELAEVLRGGGYEVTLLTGSDKDKALRPTRANVLRHLQAVLGACKRHDTVLIGLAGHGLQFEAQKDSYFCPSDGNPSKPDADLRRQRPLALGHSPCSGR